MPDLLTALVGLIVFVISATLHEAAHAWAAMMGGDPTAYHGGQVTLDPTPHIKREPIGMVVLPLISAFAFGLPMGYASAPFNPGWAFAFPKRAALMALAGPGANLVLALLALIGMWIGLGAGWFELPALSKISYTYVVAAPDGAAHAAAVFLSTAYSLNLLLLVFNLIPVPPLDGATAVPLFISDDAAKRWFQWIWRPGGIGAYGIFIAWIIIYRGFAPIWVGAFKLVHVGAFS
ncbi:MAG: site-2 protease family protein [Planctomycetota bacterium]|jgi:Zn-dependent protease